MTLPTGTACPKGHLPPLGLVPGGGFLFRLGSEELAELEVALRDAARVFGSVGDRAVAFEAGQGAVGLTAGVWIVNAQPLAGGGAGGLLDGCVARGLRVASA